MAATPVTWPERRRPTATAVPPSPTATSVPPPAAPAAPLAIDRLYREQFPRLVTLATGWLGDWDAAEDVAREALIRLDRALAGGLPIARPSAWLTRVARNLAVSQLRAQARQVSLTDAAEPGAWSAAPGGTGLLADPGDLIEQRERLDEVLAALRRLRPQDRDDLLLGLRAPDQTTAAASRGLSGAAWSARLARARAALRLAMRPPSAVGMSPDASVVERRQVVAALVAQGRQPAAIARELGLARHLVVADVIALRRRGHDQTTDGTLAAAAAAPAVALLRPLLPFGDGPAAASDQRSDRPSRPTGGAADACHRAPTRPSNSPSPCDGTRFLRLPPS